MVAKVYKAPKDWTEYPETGPLVFLAGSIEMGTADPWQDQVTLALEDKRIRILNPRRDDWDSSWEQSVRNPKFVEQVNWELEGLQDADAVLMYFQPSTMSPITLLELGLMAELRSWQESEMSNDVKMLVCCPEGYWRKGNVDVVCGKYKIPTVPTFEEFMLGARRLFR